MKLNIAMLTGRIEVMRAALSHLEELSSISKKDFLNDYKNCCRRNVSKTLP